MRSESNANNGIYKVQNSIAFWQVSHLYQNKKKRELVVYDAKEVRQQKNRSYYRIKNQKGEKTWSIKYPNIQIKVEITKFQNLKNRLLRHNFVNIQKF